MAGVGVDSAAHGGLAASAPLRPGVLHVHGGVPGGGGESVVTCIHGGRPPLVALRGRCLALSACPPRRATVSRVDARSTCAGVEEGDARQFPGPPPLVGRVLTGAGQPDEPRRVHGEHGRPPPPPAAAKVVPAPSTARRRRPAALCSSRATAGQAVQARCAVDDAVQHRVRGTGVERRTAGTRVMPYRMSLIARALSAVLRPSRARTAACGLCGSAGCARRPAGRPVASEDVWWPAVQTGLGGAVGGERPGRSCYTKNAAFGQIQGCEGGTRSVPAGLSGAHPTWVFTRLRAGSPSRGSEFGRRDSDRPRHRRWMAAGSRGGSAQRSGSRTQTRLQPNGRQICSSGALRAVGCLGRVGPRSGAGHGGPRRGRMGRRGPPGLPRPLRRSSTVIGSHLRMRR